MTAWVVEIEYNTEHDGAEVTDDIRDWPRTLHGPFESFDAAGRWADLHTDGDTDVHDVRVISLNDPDER